MHSSTFLKSLAVLYPLPHSRTVHATERLVEGVVEFRLNRPSPRPGLESIRFHPESPNKQYTDSWPFTLNLDTVLKYDAAMQERVEMELVGTWTTATNPAVALSFGIDVRQIASIKINPSVKEAKAWLPQPSIDSDLNDNELEPRVAESAIAGSSQQEKPSVEPSAVVAFLNSPLLFFITALPELTPRERYQSLNEAVERIKDEASRQSPAFACPQPELHLPNTSHPRVRDVSKLLEKSRTTQAQLSVALAQIGTWPAYIQNSHHDDLETEGKLVADLAHLRAQIRALPELQVLGLESQTREKMEVIIRELRPPTDGPGIGQDQKAALQAQLKDLDKLAMDQFERELLYEAYR